MGKKNVRTKEPRKKYNTVGVRFLDNLQVAKVYTYRIKLSAKVILGQELVADTLRGPAIVVVVRLDKIPQDTDAMVEYKYITRKVSQL